MIKLFAVILLWIFLWWLGNAIVSGYRAGNPAFVEVYERVFGAMK